MGWPVRSEQNLSDVWTAEYALELLTSKPGSRSRRLAHKLGDWKTSISVGVAWVFICKRDSNSRGMYFRQYLSLKVPWFNLKCFLFHSLLVFTHFVESLVQHCPVEFSFGDGNILYVCPVWLAASHMYLLSLLKDD